MYHVVIFALTFVLGFAMWHIVRSSPRALVYLLPPGPTFVVGTFLLILGIFAAFLAAYVLRSADLMLAMFVYAYIGFWILLIRSAGDEQTLKRMFAMMGALQLTIIGIYYADDPRLMATIMLLMTAVGFWLTTNYLRFLDRGR